MNRTIKIHYNISKQKIKYNFFRKMYWFFWFKSYNGLSLLFYKQKHESIYPIFLSTTCFVLNSYWCRVLPRCNTKRFWKTKNQWFLTIKIDFKNPVNPFICLFIANDNKTTGKQENVPPVKVAWFIKKKWVKNET